MTAPEPDDFVQSPNDGWLMAQPQLRGGASAPKLYRRCVAAESKAHAVPDGEPKQAGASSPDARMMRAAILSDPWLFMAGGE